MVPIEELTHSSPSGSLLPEAISQALGISLSEVFDLYFGGIDAIDRWRMEVEDREWLERESRRRDHEDLYHGEPDDTY
jgi:hypothetical protein